MSPRTRLAFIEPASPKLVDRPPAGPGWIHEIKQDGYRTQLILEDGKARAFSRRAIDWTERYAPIVKAAAKIKAKAAILDGEMIVTDADGKSDFHQLLTAVHREPERLVFVAFDLLHLDDEDLRGLPLSERRARLEKLITPKLGGKIVFSQGIEMEGADVFAAVEQLGLEGIVSKRLASPYRSGSKTGWVKTKCYEETTLSVIGVDKTPKGAPVALLAEGGEYRGNAFISLPEAAREAFWTYVEKAKLPKAALSGITGHKKATWIKPGLTARVRHLRGEEPLRHATVREISRA